MKKITTLLLLQLSLAAVIVLQILTMAIPLPILQIYAQQQSNTGTAGISQSLSELINSVALLVGVVAPLIVSGLAYVKAKSQDPKINQAIDTGIHVGRIATATANKALENKQNIISLIEVGLKAAPHEAQQAIDEKKALIDKLNKEIQATEAQIKRITPMIPGQANADTIPDLPREEDFKTS
jgi:flagellar basal body-associated protein FliL